MLDNIVLFYIFFTIVGFLAAMLGTIIGAGGGLIFVPLFMYWFPEWSPSMIVGTSLFSVMCNAISGSIAYLKQKKVYISAALVFSVATFPGAILGAQMSGWFSGKGFMFASELRSCHCTPAWATRASSPATLPPQPSSEMPASVTTSPWLKSSFPPSVVPWPPPATGKSA